MKTPEEVEREALINECESLLADCTDKQRALFAKVFPGWPSRQDREALHNALRLLNRTAAKREAEFDG